MYFYIRSMSEYQSKIYDKLTFHIVELDEHLIKVCLYPVRQERDHWINEIYSFANVVPKLKGKNKFPSEKFIRNALSVNEDILDNLTKRVMFDYGQDQIDVSDVYEFVCKYHQWLAHELSSKGIVNRFEVKAIILSLLNEHMK